jgi:replicative DNA helicase
MKLSAPIYYLKRKAKLLSREKCIALHEALDRVAVEEGCRTWSLLVAKLAASTPAARLLSRLDPGDLVLLGARPGHGKTLMSLQLAVEAMKQGRQAAFFTLEYTEKDVLDRFRDIGEAHAQFDGLFKFDGSEAICADYIIESMASAPREALVVVDYLQVLDQKRTNPELADQVRALKSFARYRGLIVVCISQIDRSYDPSRKAFPDLRDVRLPNPIDLHLFDKSCLLHDGEVQFGAAA